MNKTKYAPEQLHLHAISLHLVRRHCCCCGYWPLLPAAVHLGAIHLGSSGRRRGSDREGGADAMTARRHGQAEGGGEEEEGQAQAGDGARGRHLCVFLFVCGWVG